MPLKNPIFCWWVSIWSVYLSTTCIHNIVWTKAQLWYTYDRGTLEIHVPPEKSRELTLLLMGVNLVFRQCMHVEASLSGTQTAACSVAGFLFAEEERKRGRGGRIVWDPAACWWRIRRYTWGSIPCGAGKSVSFNDPYHFTRELCISLWECNIREYNNAQLPTYPLPRD